MLKALKLVVIYICFLFIDSDVFLFYVYEMIYDSNYNKHIIFTYVAPIYNYIILCYIYHR